MDWVAKSDNLVTLPRLGAKLNGLPPQPQEVAAMSRVVLTRRAVDAQQVAAISRVALTRRAVDAQQVAAISRIILLRTP
jgi:hypothetical protein